MCQWKETDIPFLYAHDTRQDTIFFYTHGKKPESLFDGFWNQGFILVFTGWPVTEQEELRKLQERLLAYEKRNLTENPGVSAFILWIENNAAPAQNWKCMALKASEEGQSVVLTGETDFLMDIYTFGLARGAAISVEKYEAEGEKLLFSSRRSAAEFICDGGVFSRMKECFLLMEGDMAGCFAFFLAEPVTLFGLQAGICYSMQTETPQHGRNIDSFFHAVLAPDQEMASLEGRLDVLNVFDAERSFFWMPEGTWRTAFPIYLSSENLALQTKKECAKLVFAKRRTQVKVPAHKFYLTFEGSFTIVNNDGSLFLGMNGQEYIDFTKEKHFYFVSGKRGYFPLEETGNTTEAITGDTAYAAFEEGTYYSQAMENSFYTAEGSEGIRNYAQISFCRLDREICFPFLPLGSFDTNSLPGEKLWQNGGSDIKAALDQRRLSAKRNELFSGTKNRNAVFDSSQEVLSAKGLYGVIDSGGDCFERLEFCDKLRFGKVGGVLKRAFLASYAFLVIDNAEEFLKAASLLPEKPPLEIGGWTFHFEPDVWEENGTFFIAKYTSHKSIRGLAAALDEWSYPAAGSDLRRNAGSRLSAFLDNLSRKESDAAFARLREILDDPLWCGMIACSVPVDGANLPDNLKFLIRTRDNRPLQAHHLIFDRRMMDQDGTLSAGEVSGVLCYEDPEHPVAAEGSDFYYKLDMLKVTFEQSRLTSFQCQISLTIPSFLGLPLYVPDSGYGNYMILTGYMTEDEEGGVTNCFFNLEDAIEYFAGKSPLKSFRVEEVKLVSSATEEKNSFFLSGRFRFAKLQTDILSYGDSEEETEDTVESGLVFSDLLLQEEKGEFRIHTGTIKFHHEISRPRVGSLAEQFSMTVQGFLTGSGKEDLDRLGYEGIQVDGIRQEELDGAFLAVCFRIDLGGLGALASVGNIGMLLLAAWSAGTVQKKGEGGIIVGESPCYIGAKLGNARGVNGLLPLQGIMGMSMDSVELKSSEKGTFYLYFRNFSIKILNYGFPPGSNDIYVFSSPQADGELGWYAAYEAK